MPQDTSFAIDRRSPPRLPGRDRLLVLAGLAVLTTLSWIYLLSLGAAMDAPGMSAMQMEMQPWGVREIALAFLMWSIMMVAMMLPSAAPMILLYSAVQRRWRSRPFLFIALFVCAYIVVWTLFSAVATALQGMLTSLRLLVMDRLTSEVLGGGLLIAAGLYQWTGLKQRCLEHCQSPVAFVTHHWRPGLGGAWRMGLAHGLYCLGCCWVLMALLFVFGVMNLLWVALLAVLVLLEKVLPAGPWAARVIGVALVIWGGVLMFA